MSGFFDSINMKTTEELIGTILAQSINQSINQSNLPLAEKYARHRDPSSK